MNTFSEYNFPIDGVSLLFADGSSKFYTEKELMRLIKDIVADMALEFAVVRFTNGASPLIIRDVKELFNFLGLKF